MEMQGCEWSVIDVNRLLVHVRDPHPMERMEEEWMMEGEEVSIISLSVRVPADVILTSGDASGTLSVIVNELSESD